MDPVSVGFSPCPNDTFMFHALVERRVPGGPKIRPVLLDIEALNERAAGPPNDRLPYTKVSVAALGALRDDVVVLRAGAALGRGCGPLVVARPGRFRSLADLAGARVAVPGLRTTAAMLLRFFGPKVRTVPMRFDRVAPAVLEGRVDAGLMIHEMRFVYADRGLAKVADLGQVWEAETGLPLPLGVITARRCRPAQERRIFERALAASVACARRNPAASAAFVAAHAREMDPGVCRRHIDLYVNEFSVDLGEEGIAAVRAFLARQETAGLAPSGPDLFDEASG